MILLLTKFKTHDYNSTAYGWTLGGEGLRARAGAINFIASVEGDADEDTAG